MEHVYYRHFKGKPYRFLYFAKHTETGEELVVYQALYGDALIWARPREMFFGTIERDGYSGPRFIPVDLADILADIPEDLRGLLV